MRRALIALALPEMAAGVLLAWAVTNTSPEADPPVVDVSDHGVTIIRPHRRSKR
jgi:hypothetical protein